jgi:hypothetical protein
LKLDPRRLGVLIWTLIYGGLFAAGLGIALARNGDEAAGTSVIAVGAIAIAAGVVLIWVRSRMPEP